MLSNFRWEKSFYIKNSFFHSRAQQFCENWLKQIESFIFSLKFNFNLILSIFNVISQTYILEIYILAHVRLKAKVLFNKKGKKMEMQDAVQKSKGKSQRKLFGKKKNKGQSHLNQRIYCGHNYRFVDRLYLYSVSNFFNFNIIKHILNFV